MMLPLNSIEPKRSSSKEENVLVLLKYKDQFIYFTIFESCLSSGLLVSAQNFTTIPWIKSVAFGKILVRVS